MPETHIYLDCDAFNNNLYSNEEIELHFQQNRNIPYIDDDTRNYFCSIVRFSIITSNTLPVFIPRIDTRQTNPDMTIYKISIVQNKFSWDFFFSSLYVI